MGLCDVLTCFACVSPPTRNHGGEASDGAGLLRAEREGLINEDREPGLGPTFLQAERVSEPAAALELLVQADVPTGAALAAPVEPLAVDPVNPSARLLPSTLPMGAGASGPSHTSATSPQAPVAIALSATAMRGAAGGVREALTQPLNLLRSRTASVRAMQGMMRSFSSLVDSTDTGGTGGVPITASAAAGTGSVSGSCIVSHAPQHPTESEPAVAAAGRRIAAAVPVSAAVGPASLSGAGGITVVQPLDAGDFSTALDLDALTTADLTLDVQQTVAAWSGAYEDALVRGVSSSLAIPALAGLGLGLLGPSAVPAEPEGLAGGGSGQQQVAAVPLTPIGGSGLLGSVLNLAQVRDCVTDLRVLHIRPGAALLIGRATATGNQVVARFERGRPEMLLAPQLLRTLTDGHAGRTARHPNVVALEQVHVIALPAHVLDTPPCTAAAVSSLGLCGGSAVVHAAPLLSTSRTAHSSSAGFMGGDGTATALSAAPSLEQLPAMDQDAIIATLALQQAEAVRGAGQSSGVIGTRNPSTGTGTGGGGGSGRTGSARLLHAMHGPPVRLTDVVGHLRDSRRLARGNSAVAESGVPSPGMLGGMEHRYGYGGSSVGISFGSPAGVNTMGAARATATAAVPQLLEVGFVTLCINELVEGSNLHDEARRGAFRCGLGDRPPVSSAAGRRAASGHIPVEIGAASGVAGSGTGSRRPYSDMLNPAAVFRSPALVARLERFVLTATEVARGLRHLHAALGLPHGDLVSRNVLLHRSGGGGSCNGPDDTRGYVARLVGYGRMAPPPAQLASVSSAVVMDAGLGEAPVGGRLCEEPSGGVSSAAAREASGGGFYVHSATSITRLQQVQVGLWRDVHSLAPERLLDPSAPPSIEADVYAMGTIFYEMAMGEAPWAGMSAACVAVGTATGDMRITCPQPCAVMGITTLIESCTSPRPEQRPSMAEVLAALQDIGKEVLAGKELVAARRQERNVQMLMHALLDSSDSN